MAVEASYMNFPPSQIFTNREFMKPNQQQQLLNIGVYNNAQMNSPLPLLPTTTMGESMPFYQQTFCDPNKADSGLTYHNYPLQRKRSRDFINTEFTSLPPHQKNKLSSQSPLFFDQEIINQFQNQQSEIDCVIAHHTEKVRMELDEQRMRQSKTLLNVIHDAMAKKLKEKDEEIEKIGKLNLMLQERVKNLCAENQVWREMAQANETTANYLRSNLEQVLANVGEERYGVAAAHDAQSSCGSNDAAENEDDTAATPAATGGCGGIRMCKNCGVRESMVLLLPCRHLCLCKMCGSTVHKCPVCDSSMDASVHVNLS